MKSSVGPPDLRQRGRVVGIRQTLKALRAGRIGHLYVAADAAPGLMVELVEEAAADGIAIDRSYTKAELGRVSGVAVGAAAVGILLEPADGSVGRPLTAD